MSRHKPKSLLAFIWCATIDPPYRLEMHMDMEAAFERFAVVDTVVKKACYGVEQAAYRLRHNSDDVGAQHPTHAAPHAAAAKQMALTTQELFEMLRRELVADVSSGKFLLLPPGRLAAAIDPVAATAGEPVGAPWSAVEMPNPASVSVKPGRLLLEYAYFFFHFPEARTAIMSNLAVIETVPGLRSASGVVAALKVVAAALVGPPAPSEDEVGSAIAVLCTSMQEEYATRSYLTCW